MMRLLVVPSTRARETPITSIAALDAPYAMELPVPEIPAREEMLMITASPLAFIRLRKARMVAKGPRTLVIIT